MYITKSHKHLVLYSIIMQHNAKAYGRAYLNSDYLPELLGKNK